jgi:hypothetical protein
MSTKTKDPRSITDEEFITQLIEFSVSKRSLLYESKGSGGLLYTGNERY